MCKLVAIAIQLKPKSRWYFSTGTLDYINESYKHVGAPPGGTSHNGQHREAPSQRGTILGFRLRYITEYGNLSFSYFMVIISFYLLDRT